MAAYPSGAVGAPTPCRPEARTRAYSSTTCTLLHVNRGEVLEPALRADKALDVLGHRPGITVMDDEHPGRVVNKDLVRFLDIGDVLLRVGRLFNPVDQRVVLRVLPIRPVAALWRHVGRQ